VFLRASLNFFSVVRLEFFDHFFKKTQKTNLPGKTVFQAE